jgi:hypothetical protein
MVAHRLVVTKLVETAARGLFMLVCIYALPLEEAGRFGLIATAVGLLAFALGFERQIDVLRRVTGLPSGACATETSPLYLAFNRAIARQRLHAGVMPI